MNARQPADDPSVIVIDCQKRVFDKEKMFYFNYFEKFLDTAIEDLVVLSQSIFIIIREKSSSKVNQLHEIILFLTILFGKHIFIIPSRSNIIDLVSTVFGDEFIEDVQVDISRSRVLIKIGLNTSKKKDFFKEYRNVLYDVSFLFENLLHRCVSMQFL